MSSIASTCISRAQSFPPYNSAEHLQLMFAGRASVVKSPSPLHQQTPILIDKAEIILRQISKESHCSKITAIQQLFCIPPAYL